MLAASGQFVDRGVVMIRARGIALLLAALFVFPLLMAAPEGQARGAATPRLADGTAVREENSFLIYKMVGDAKV
jgi:hypothetical protein